MTAIWCAFDPLGIGDTRRTRVEPGALIPKMDPESAGSACPHAVLRITSQETRLADALPRLSATYTGNDARVRVEHIATTRSGVDTAAIGVRKYRRNSRTEE